MNEPTDREFARLLDWLEGRLAEGEAPTAAGGTGADAVWLRAFLRAGEDTVIETPPQGFREDLISRFETRRNARRGPGFVEQLRAALQFDSGLQPAFGVRSGADREARRQLIYSSDAVDVAIDVQAGRENNLDLVGQVLPADPSVSGPYAFQLLRGDTEVSLAATDELGMFSLEGVPPGDYEAVVGGQTFEALISPVPLRH